MYRQCGIRCHKSYNYIEYIHSNTPYDHNDTVHSHEGSHNKICSKWYCHTQLHTTFYKWIFFLFFLNINVKRMMVEYYMYSWQKGTSYTPLIWFGHSRNIKVTWRKNIYKKPFILANPKSVRSVHNSYKCIYGLKSNI